MFEYKPTYWYSGLYLQPQHFQIQALHSEYWRGRYQLLTQPYAFGVVRLLFNLAALRDETLSLHQAAFIFPDGSYVDCDANAFLSPRSLRESWVDRNKPLRIYVGLRRISHNQNNVVEVANAQGASGTGSRWISWPGEQSMRDYYAEGPEVDVQQLTYNLRFFLQDEIEQATDYTLLPVGQVRMGDEGIEVDASYIPPSMTIGAVPQLWQRMAQLSQELSGRIHQFEELKSPRTLENTIFTQEKNTLLLAMRTLIRYVVRLQHYREARDVHPWKVFGVLRQLVAELTCFTERCNFMGEWQGSEENLSGYQHDDLATTFNDAESTIIALLNTLVLEPNQVVALRAQDNGYYLSGPFPAVDESARIYLALRSEHFKQSEYELPDDRLIKVASAGQIGNVVNRALPGVRLWYQELAPQGLPNRANTRYFRVENRHTLWRQIEETASAALHWPDAPTDMQSEFIIVRAE